MIDSQNKFTFMSFFVYFWTYLWYETNLSNNNIECLNSKTFNCIHSLIHSTETEWELGAESPGVQIRGKGSFSRVPSTNGKKTLAGIEQPLPFCS